MDGDGFKIIDKENKMSKKYFFFDIDGTLTDRSTGEVVPSALEAIHKLQEAGHFISLATGRLIKQRNSVRNMISQTWSATAVTESTKPVKNTDGFKGA